MKNEIIKIERFIYNGMYIDDYTVFYKNGSTRTYTIKGQMNSKHFEFLLNSKCLRIENKNGRHVGDRFTV